jgi:hypothetical protein
MLMTQDTTVGFAPEEIRTDGSTRDARLKWVVVVDETLPRGRAVNAAVCLAAATQDAVTGLLGPGARDADGSDHVGLPWAGCSVLGAEPARLAALRARAVQDPRVHVADMPVDAQRTRVYDEYLERVRTARADDLDYLAVGLVGPRRAVDKLVGGLRLLP